MVLIDGVKYACQSCVKGHRSSKCTHTTRTLVEIKKKGRPTSQCSHCRDLRKTRAVHGRCDCAARDTEERPKAKVLKNGIADLAQLTAESSEAGSLAAAQDAACNCRRGGKCSCCSVLSRAGKVKAEAPSTPALSDSPSSPTGSCSSVKGDPPIPTLAMPLQPHMYYPTTSTPFIPYQQQPLPSPHQQGYFPIASTSHMPHSFIPQQHPLGSTTPVSTPPVSGFPPPTSYASPAYPFQSAYPSPYITPTSYFSGPSASSNMNPYTCPSSQASSACFCGDSCTCAGCPQHDPLGYKRNASMTTPGILGGISCLCDEGKEQVPGAIKSCCGGALGQLQAAQAAGLSMEELMRTMVQGCAMNLAPMQWPQQQQQQPAPYQQQQLFEGMGFTPSPALMGGGGLPPLSQLWGSNSGAAQASAMLMGNYMEEPEQKPSWNAPDQAIKRKATACPSPTYPSAPSDPRTPPAPLWTGGLSSASSPQSSVGLSLNFDDMNLDSIEPGCGDACSCEQRCHCHGVSKEQGAQTRGAEGDIEELVLAAPPCRGMKIQARVQPEESTSYRPYDRPSRRRRTVQSPLTIECLPEPASIPTPPSASITAHTPASTCASFGMPSPLGMGSSFDDFGLTLDSMTAADIEGFASGGPQQPYEQSAADTVAATGRVLESPKMPYLQMAELIAAGFC